MVRNKLHFMKRAIYKLKRSYGLPVVLQKIEQHSTDPETGVKSTVLGAIHIDRAIVLRAREFRSFVYDLAYISANKDFTTGGFFDPEDRRALVDADDLEGYEPNVGDHVIFQAERYDIKNVFHFENNLVYGFLLRKLRGSDIVSMHTAHSGLVLTQTATSETVSKLIREATSVINLTQDLKEVP